MLSDFDIDRLISNCTKAGYAQAKVDMLTFVGELLQDNSTNFDRRLMCLRMQSHILGMELPADEK